MRRAICKSAGVYKEIPAGEKPSGFWGKTIPIALGGSVAATIPAGLFAATPVISHAIQANGARDYAFRLSAIAANADGSFAITGLVRQSQPVVLGGDSFGPLTTAVTLHLVAIESD